LKTSISLDEKLISKIDDYRAAARPIPSMSRAVIDLIKIALESKKEIPKEDNTENAEFEKTINLQEERNRFNLVFYASDLECLKSKGIEIENGMKVKVAIGKSVKEAS
jgi:metal-responsive CopG/Arc/MetJ family transcriptional regulator